MVENPGALSELARDAFLLPTGIVARMGVLAAGREKKTDPLKDASDAAWWSKPYRLDLWTNLGTYIGVLDKAGVDSALDWGTLEESIAAGDASSIAVGLSEVRTWLDEIHRAGWGNCAPWIIPTRPKAGQWPTRNAVCIKQAPDLRPVVDAAPRLPSIPWWLIVGAILLVGERRRSRR